MTDAEFQKKERKLIKHVLAFARENQDLILNADKFATDMQEDNLKLQKAFKRVLYMHGTIGEQEAFDEICKLTKQDFEGK